MDRACASSTVSTQDGAKQSNQVKKAIANLEKVVPWLLLNRPNNVDIVCQASFNVVSIVSMIEAKRRRFEAQRLGILQKDEKLPDGEYQQMLSWGAKLPDCFFQQIISDTTHFNFKCSL